MRTIKVRPQPATRRERICSRLELGDRVAKSIERENSEDWGYAHQVIRHRANLAIALDGRHPLARAHELKSWHIADCP